MFNLIKKFLNVKDSEVAKGDSNLFSEKSEKTDQTIKHKNVVKVLNPEIRSSFVEGKEVNRKEDPQIESKQYINIDIDFYSYRVSITIHNNRGIHKFSCHLWELEKLKKTSNFKAYAENIIKKINDQLGMTFEEYCKDWEEDIKKLLEGEGAKEERLKEERSFCF